MSSGRHHIKEQKKKRPKPIVRLVINAPLSPFPNLPRLASPRLAGLPACLIFILSRGFFSHVVYLDSFFFRNFFFFGFLVWFCLLLSTLTSSTKNACEFPEKITVEYNIVQGNLERDKKNFFFPCPDPPFGNKQDGIAKKK